MIERFNFYDIYGYLLPGLALGALLGLPLALIAGKLPPAELASAVAAAALGYVIGQIAHAFAKRLFGNERPFAAEVQRLPPDGKERLKKQLIAVAGSHIDVSDSRSVFLICRRALQDRKRGGLADQFQGMYALTRGLALAFYAAASYYSGVCIAGFVRQLDHDWTWLLLALAPFTWLAVAWMNGQKATKTDQKKDSWRLAERVTAVLVLAVFGVVAGWFVPPHPHRFIAFGISVPFCLLFAISLHRVSSEHDVGVARTILNDFMVESPAGVPDDKPSKE